MASIRAPAVAGMFYPGEPKALDAELDDLLGGVDQPAPRLGFPKALIVPHAGYIYSGQVAARAYDEVAPARGMVRRVVMLGPSHRVPVRGLAVPGAQAFATPLGAVPLEREALRAVQDLPQVVTSDAAHALEHSLEVQLPFLQQVLGDFMLLPLAVGEATADEVAAVLEQVWGGDETLIVISSDLSHFLPDAAARKVDGGTVDAILALDPHLNHEQACGATPVNGLLLVVLCITVFSIVERDKDSSTGLIDYINIALAAVTLLINAIALSAILFRLASFGFTPNRVIVLGANLIIMVHLARMCWAYFRVVRGRAGFTGMRWVVTSYLPVYGAWAAVVAFLLPLAFWFS